MYEKDDNKEAVKVLAQSASDANDRLSLSQKKVNNTAAKLRQYESKLLNESLNYSNK